MHAFPLQKTSLITVKGIGLTENEYTAKIKSLSNGNIPDSAVCYKGLFAFLGANGSIAKNFLENIT